MCPELDVVRRGYTVEEALKNLKEVCGLYVEEMGIPEGVSSEDIPVTSFEVKSNETAKVVRP